jgi:hypothetical protein
MPPVPFEDHQPFPLDFLVRGKTVLAAIALPAAADGRTFS